MNNCKTCKHWQKRDEYETGHSQGLGKCAAALMLWDCTEWRDDGSDYRADLLTMPDFGCVSHEAL